MFDCDDLLTIANRLYIPVTVDGWSNSWDYVWDMIEIDHRRNAFALAHEMAHATSKYSRLNRRSMAFYARVCRSGLPHARAIQRTATRVEEAIADRVAEILTGRDAYTVRLVHKFHPYPPVTPRTRADYYVEVKAREAVEWILSQEIIH